MEERGLCLQARKHLLWSISSVNPSGFTGMESASHWAVVTKEIWNNQLGVFRSSFSLLMSEQGAAS